MTASTRPARSPLPRSAPARWRTGSDGADGRANCATPRGFGKEKPSMEIRGAHPAPLRRNQSNNYALLRRQGTALIIRSHRIHRRALQRVNHELPDPLSGFTTRTRDSRAASSQLAAAGTHHQTNPARITAGNTLARFMARIIPDRGRKRKKVPADVKSFVSTIKRRPHLFTVFIIQNRIEDPLPHSFKIKYHEICGDWSRMTRPPASKP